MAEQQDIGDRTLGRTIRKRLALVSAVLAMLLFVGYVRLPYAAVRNLDDSHLLLSNPGLHWEETACDADALQKWWIRIRMQPIIGSEAPRFSVNVHWYAGILARVNASHYIGSTGAEGRDSLYIWCFGLWLPLYDFHHVMA